MNKSGILTNSKSNPKTLSKQGKLPAGWKTVRFGDVVKDVKESEKNPLEAGLDRYIGLEHIEPENLHIKQWGDLNEDQVSFTKRFRKGQVLFGKRRAYQRKVAVAEFDGICSSDILTLEPKRDDLLPELLPFIVQSDAFFEHALDTSSGSLSPRTRWSQLKEFEFPLPPKDEQQRIADILSEVDQLTQKFQASLTATFKSHDITSAHILREGFGDLRLVATPIGLIPETWKVVRLGDLSDVRYGLTINKKRDTFPLRRPYLRVANVQRNSLVLDEIKDVGCNIRDVSDFELKKNDLLIVEGHADVHEIGRAALWSGEITECLHQNHILRVRCKNSLLPRFALAWLNSPRGRSYFYRFSQSTSGLNTINSSVLKNSLIPVPPIKVQNQLCDVIDAFEDSKLELGRHLNTVTSLSVQLRENLLKGAGK